MRLLHQVGVFIYWYMMHGTMKMKNLRYDTLCRTTPYWWASVWEWDNMALWSWRYETAYRKVPHLCSMFLCSSSDWSDFYITLNVKSKRVLRHFSSIRGSQFTKVCITCAHVHYLLYVFEWNVFRHVTRKAQNGVFEKVVLRRICCLYCRSNKESENVRNEKAHDLCPTFLKL